MVVFLDDIIGSGETFISDVSPVVVKTNKVGEKVELQNEWTIGRIVKADMPYKVALLSCIMMDKGKTRLEATFPFVKLYGEERIHAFSKNKSPFGGYLKMKQVRDFAISMGRKFVRTENLAIQTPKH